MGESEYFLPLLYLLSVLPERERQMLIEHFDERTVLYLTDSVVATVLRSNASVNQKIKESLKKEVQKFKGEFETIVSTDSYNKRKKALAEIGGYPLSIILASILPSVIGYLDKRKK